MQSHSHYLPPTTLEEALNRIKDILKQLSEVWCYSIQENKGQVATFESFLLYGIEGKTKILKWKEEHASVEKLIEKFIKRNDFILAEERKTDQKNFAKALEPWLQTCRFYQKVSGYAAYYKDEEERGLKAIQERATLVSRLEPMCNLLKQLYSDYRRLLEHKAEHKQQPVPTAIPVMPQLQDVPAAPTIMPQAQTDPAVTVVLPMTDSKPVQVNRDLEEVWQQAACPESTAFSVNINNRQDSAEDAQTAEELERLFEECYQPPMYGLDDNIDDSAKEFAAEHQLEPITVDSIRQLGQTVNSVPQEQKAMSQPMTNQPVQPVLPAKKSTPRASNSLFRSQLGQKKQQIAMRRKMVAVSAL